MPAFPTATLPTHCLRNSAMSSVPEAESEIARFLLIMTMIMIKMGNGRMLDRLTARVKTKSARTTASVTYLASSSMARSLSPKDLDGSAVSQW